MKLKEAAKQAGGGTRDLFMLPPSMLQIEPGWNLRIRTPEYEQGIKELAESIRAFGVLEPLTIHRVGDDNVITNGHRRFEAINLLLSETPPVEIQSIPVRLEEKGNNEADRVGSMFTRNSGVRLTQLEEAIGIKRLLGYGWNEDKISVTTQLSKQVMSNRLALLEAPADVMHMVEAGEISPTMAVNTVRKEGALLAGPKLKDAVEVARESGKSKATAKHVAKTEGKAPNKSAGPLSSNIAWDAWGPKFETAVIDIINAPGHAAQQAAIDKAAQLLEELRG